MRNKLSFYNNNSENVWSGFVDVLTNILIVFVFLLLIFMLSHFFLLTPSNKNNSEAVIKLNDQVNKLSKILISKSEELNKIQLEIDNKSNQIELLDKNLDVALKKAEIETNKQIELKNQINNLNNMIYQMEGEIISKENQIKERKINEKNLKKSINDLNRELQKLNDVFEATDKYIKWQNVQIVELGKKLNRSLANKAAELYKVRSKFFEKISVVLKDDKNFKLEGDRIVIQSELFFKSGSYEIEKEGKTKLNEVAELIKNLEKTIDPEVDWIVRIDGHTDNVPTIGDTSNWELSLKRALAVLQYLQSRNVDSKRLAATGFGEHQPIADNSTAEGRKQNRRIEFKLTEK